MPSEIDRYPVDPLNGAAQFKDWMRGIERDIRDLRGSRPLGATTLSNGTLRVVDADGNEMIRVGLLDDTEYGIDIKTLAEVGIPENGDIVLFRADGRGLVRPRLVTWTRPNHTPQPVTSGSYVTSHQAYAREALTSVLTVTLGLGTDASTTGELYLTSNDPAVTDSPVYTWTGAKNVEINWQHGSAVGQVRLVVTMMVRRAGGAGNVLVYEPYGVGSASVDDVPLDTWTVL